MYHIIIHKFLKAKFLQSTMVDHFLQSKKKTYENQNPQNPKTIK